MESTSPAAVATASATASSTASAATLAKGALRRLAQAQQEPTPDNDARAYADEAGQAAPAAMGGTPEADAVAGLKALGHAWVRVMLVEKLAHHLDRGGKQWTGARRKDSVKRVLQGSRSDPRRLLQRLQLLRTAWEADAPSDPAHTGVEDPPLEMKAPLLADAGAWPPIVASLQDTV